MLEEIGSIMIIGALVLFVCAPEKWAPALGVAVFGLALVIVDRALPGKDDKS